MMVPVGKYVTISRSVRKNKDKRTMQRNTVRNMTLIPTELPILYPTYVSYSLCVIDMLWNADTPLLTSQRGRGDREKPQWYDCRRWHRMPNVKSVTAPFVLCRLLLLVNPYSYLYYVYDEGTDLSVNARQDCATPEPL